MRYLTGNGNTEDGLYFYHGNHLSSTQLITDINANISQAVLYTPWGSVIKEYKADWMLDTIPRYLFNAKEKDEESGLYYYEARYYSDENIMFTARDPLFEKYPFMSPYAYCNNNPIKLIDPDGRSPRPPAHHHFLRTVGVQVYNSARDNGASANGAVLVLAQAALESGWGQSAMKYNDYNLFGVMGTPSKRSTSHGSVKDYSNSGGYDGAISDYFSRTSERWSGWADVLAQNDFTSDDIDKALNTGDYFPTREERFKGKYAYNGDKGTDGKNNYGKALMKQFNFTKKMFMNSLKYQVDENNKTINQPIPYSNEYIDKLKNENKELNSILYDLE
jgi:RHS repeat-associated protein